MATIYLALGSNVGESHAYIRQAIQLLGASITDIVEAPVYISKAIGYTEQADFYNTAIAGTTELTPDALLVFIKHIEQQVGRIARFRWGPREIDIDIILYDNLVLEQPGLSIPHPRFRERDFVLEPLCQLSPNVIDPVSLYSVQELLQQIPAADRSILNRA